MVGHLLDYLDFLSQKLAAFVVGALAKEALYEN